MMDFSQKLTSPRAAKKFKDDGFIPDHLADNVNWNGGEDVFDFENTTYWRKN